MRFVVLGSLAIESERPIAVRGPQLRRVLAMLLLDAGRVVPVDRIAEAVFDGEPSDAAATTLRSYVARLRRLLADDGSEVAIITEQPGYRLRLGTSTIDAQIFERELDEAQRALLDRRPADAVDSLERALALWRGPAFGELSDEEWVRLEARRLDGRRVDAQEMRLSALVEAGHHEVAITDLEAFVEEHPMRTAGWSTLMLALYRSGRQPEAMRVAARHRAQVGAVGLDPAPEVESLEKHIATDDPAIRSSAPSTRRLRGYQLVEQLGSGRRGGLYRALQPGIDRDVALRVLGADLADRPDFVRHFDPLVRRVAALEHPSIVPILDFWREPGLAAIVTRLLRGGSLVDTIAKGPAAAGQVAAMVESVAEALAAAHTVGLVHGVLVPGDVLFDDDANAYVDGIGIAAEIDDLLQIPPPEAYAPPEALRSSAGDQYALAAIAYHALTGFTPFGALQVDGTFPRVSEARPELLALDGVLARAGARIPDDRYPDVVTFAAGFAAALGGRQSTTRRGRTSVPNPYKGLRPFLETDSDRFFGRDGAVAELVTAIAGSITGESFVTLVGPSGSGKSSVVRAGLLPRIRAGAITTSERWFVATMVPGEDPFRTLSEAVSGVAAGSRAVRVGADEPMALADALHDALPPEVRLVLVIDQLEELFTLVPDEARRRAFISRLCEAVADDRCRLSIVATLRADFYDRPLAHHVLGRLVAEHTVALAAMTPAELEQAIVEPAAAVGVAVDGAVVAELVAACADRPGVLPLLQFCLTELFDARTGRRITISDYQQLGGIDGAVAGRVEQIYASLTPDEQHATRRLLLRLVEFAGATADLRRRVTRTELAGMRDGGSIDRVIELLGDARLLSFDRAPETREQTVEVAHEALLRSWPRLLGWLGEEGSDLEVRSELTGAARAWDEAGRDDGHLYRGARLSLAEELWTRRDEELTDIERDFVVRSIAVRDAELTAQRRANRRLRLALTGVVGVLLVAAVLGALAYVQRDRARDQASRAERERAQTLAVTATEQIDEDRGVALLLALEANRADDTVFTRRALLTALSEAPPFSRTTIDTPAGDYRAIAVSADETVAVAKRGSGEVDVIDLATRSVRHAGIPTPTRIDHGIDVDPSGSLAVSAGDPIDGVAATVIDLESGGVVAELPGDLPSFYEARFVQGGDRLAVGAPDGRVVLYDTETWGVVSMIDLGEERTITAMQADDDGSTLYVGATPLDGFEALAPANLYAIDTEEPELARAPLELDEDFVTDIEIDGSLGLLVATADTALRAFSIDDLAPVGEPFGQSAFDGYTAVAISPDGLVIGASPVDFDAFVLGNDESSDGAGEQWMPVDAGDPPKVFDLVFGDEGRRLVAATPDGRVALMTTGWIDDLGTALEPAGPGLVTVDPTGDVVAVWARGRGVQFFDRASLAHRGALPIGSDRGFVGLDFDASGQRLLTMTCPWDADPCPAELTVWDVRTLERRVGPVAAGPVWAGLLAGAAFTGDDTAIVTANADGAVHRWDAETLRPAGTPLALADVEPRQANQVRAVVSGSADGRSLIVATGGLDSAVVWDITEGDSTVVGLIDGGVADIGFTPDGLLIISKGTGTFEFRDPWTLDPIGAPFVGEVPTFAFRFADAESGRMVSTGTLGSVVWDIESRQPLTGTIPSAVSDLSPDGRTVYLGAVGFPDAPSGTEVRALSLDPSDLVADACARAGRNLSRSEWEHYLPGTEYRRTCAMWPEPDTW